MNIYPMHFNDDRYTDSHDSGKLQQTPSSTEVPASSKGLVVPMIFHDNKAVQKIEDEDYVPLFCQPEEPVSPKPIINPPAHSELEAPALQVSAGPVPHLPSIEPSLTPSIVPSKPTAPPDDKQSSKSQSNLPRAYDVAMELMRVQPLRMAGNALYAFDGKCYRFVSPPVMNRLIMGKCRAYVHAVGDASIIDKIYKVIQAEPEICIPDTGTAPLVALDDGLLDLTTFALQPFSPIPFVTVKLNGSYTKGSATACPTFDRFLNDVTNHDPILAERIWQAIGYAIVPDNNGKCFMLFQGVPDSGKSLLGDVIASLVDSELVTSLDINTMGERFGPAELVGKQLCLALDMPSGTLDSKAVSMFKNLTGGDPVTADVKYQNRIRFRCSATFVLATNFPLLTRDPDPAFLRRAVVIPFLNSVDKRQQDHSLKAKILTERDAIIYRALQVYARLRQANYEFSGNFQLNENITGNQNMASNDLTSTLYNFCHQFCIPKEDGFTSTSELYDAFCSHAGISWPGGIRSFSDEIYSILASLYPQKIARDRKRPKGTSQNPERGFSGIILKTFAE